MRRGRGPRAKPGNVRAWQQRSAQKAAENARTRVERPPVAKVVKKGRGPLVPGQVGRKPPPPLPKRRVEFRGPLLTGRSCFYCLLDGRNSQARQWHHWLPQERIRVYVDTLRIRDESEERRTLQRLLNDRRNISPVCVGCHEQHEHSLHGVTFTAEHVPESAHVFAAELGPEWAERLRLAYV